MNRDIKQEKKKDLGFFERYLTVWVALCIVVGVAIGQFFPAFPQTLSKFEYAQVSIPVAILIWLMIYPMMVQIDFGRVVEATKRPKGLIVTCVTNWLIKPFTMYLIAYLFLKIIFAQFISPELSTQYLGGAVLLGAALATVVGVLVEVPVMLALVRIANSTRHWFLQSGKVS